MAATTREGGEMALSESQRNLMQAMNDRGPFMEWKGGWVFMRERFMADPTSENVVMDIETGTTYYSREAHRICSGEDPILVCGGAP